MRCAGDLTSPAFLSHRPHAHRAAEGLPNGQRPQTAEGLPNPPAARPSAPPAPISPVPRHTLTRHRLFPKRPAALNGRRPPKAPKPASGAALGPSSPDTASASPTLDTAPAFSPKTAEGLQKRPKAPENGRRPPKTAEGLPKTARGHIQAQ